MKHVTISTKEAKPITEFSVTLANVRAADRRYRQLSAKHTVLDEAADQFANSLEDPLPYPDILVRQPSAMTLIIDGEVRPVKSQPFTFTKAEQISRADLPEETKAAMLAALAERNAAQAAADEASGWTVIKAGVDKAERDYLGAHAELMGAIGTLMSVPTADPREMKIKRQWVRKYADFVDDEAHWLRTMLKATMQALEVPAEPTAQSEDIAAIDFVPWEEEDACVPNDPSFWTKQNGLTKFALDVASKIVRQTREEAIADQRRQMAEANLVDGKPVVQLTHELLTDRHEFLGAQAALLECAASRLLIAASGALDEPVLLAAE